MCWGDKANRPKCPWPCGEDKHTARLAQRAELGASLGGGGGDGAGRGQRIGGDFLEEMESGLVLKVW